MSKTSWKNSEGHNGLCVRIGEGWDYGGSLSSPDTSQQSLVMNVIGTDLLSHRGASPESCYSLLSSTWLSEFTSSAFLTKYPDYFPFYTCFFDPVPAPPYQLGSQKPHPSKFITSCPPSPHVTWFGPPPPTRLHPSSGFPLDSSGIMY